MKKEKTTVVFTGDIGFDRFMSGKWTDPDLLDGTVLDYFHSADHVVANVEAAVMAAPEDGGHDAYFHVMDPAAVSVLEAMGADIWNIGNNHIMDAGKDGLDSTLRIAKERGVHTLGAGVNAEEASRPVFLEEAGGIGLISLMYHPSYSNASETAPGVLRWDDMDRIARRIAQVKAKCRWCVVVAHGGEEFNPMPSPYTRERYIRFLELGADVVVGHHPHVPENCETFPDGKAIFYSLGNFIFDTEYQRVHLYTDHALLLRLTFTEESFSFDALGTRVLRGEERIAAGPLPAIFTDISSGEYEKLAPLAAAAFLCEEKKKRAYLTPEKYAGASKEVWDGYFFSDQPDGFDKDAHMDFFRVVPLAETAKEGKWRESALEQVKDYLLRLID